MLIPQKVFRLTTITANQPHTKYGIQGIHFERQKDGTPLAIAIDGVSLLVVSWKEYPWKEYPEIPGLNSKHKKGFSVTLPNSVCVEIASWNVGNKYKPILNNILLDEHAKMGVVEGKQVKGKRLISLAATDLELTPRIEILEVEKPFLDWKDSVIPPAERPSISVCLDIARLINQLRTIKAESNCKNVILTIAEGTRKDNKGDTHYNSQEMSIILTAVGDYNEIKTYGILMPCFDSTPGESKRLEPSWRP